MHHHPGQVKVAPPTGTTVLHSACLAAAFPAPDGPPRRGDIHDQAETLEVEAPDDEVLDLPVVGSIVLNGISINPANAAAVRKRNRNTIFSYCVSCDQGMQKQKRQKCENHDEDNYDSHE